MTNCIHSCVCYLECKCWRTLFLVRDKLCMVYSYVSDSSSDRSSFKDLRARQNRRSVCEKRFTNHMSYLNIGVLYRLTKQISVTGCIWNSSFGLFVGSLQILSKSLLRTVHLWHIDTDCTVCSVIIFKFLSFLLITYLCASLKLISLRPRLVASQSFFAVELNLIHTHELISEVQVQQKGLHQRNTPM